MNLEAEYVLAAIVVGLGASRIPSPTRARIRSLATHSVFAARMYLCALGLHCVSGLGRLHVE